MVAVAGSTAAKIGLRSTAEEMVREARNPAARHIANPRLGHPRWLAAPTRVQSGRFTKAAICCIGSDRARRFAACRGVSAMASQTLA